MPTPREIASIPAKDFADELVMLITNAGLLADEKLSYKLYLLIKPVIHTALSSRDREIEELRRIGDKMLALLAVSAPEWTQEHRVVVDEWDSIKSPAADQNYIPVDHPAVKAMADTLRKFQHDAGENPDSDDCGNPKCKLCAVNKALRDYDTLTSHQPEQKEGK